MGGIYLSHFSFLAPLVSERVQRGISARTGIIDASRKRFHAEIELRKLDTWSGERSQNNPVGEVSKT